ncbi:MAG: class I SAM-dependent methyltransferase, partial [Nitrosopumilaceae archaeon]
MNVIHKTYSKLPKSLKPFSKKIYKKSGLYINPKKRNRKFLLEMMPKDSICAEIGVQQGFFSAEILKIVQPKKLFLIDPWAYYNPKKTTQARHDEFYEMVKNRMQNKPNVEILRGKSVEMLTNFPDNHFDWVYIDGDHSYEGVKADLEISYK